MLKYIPKTSYKEHTICNTSKINAVILKSKVFIYNTQSMQRPPSLTLFGII